MDSRLARLLIEELNTEYCHALDTLDLDGWTNFFSEDAMYKITSRDNHEQGLLGGIVYDDGLPMIRDRAYILKQTQYFAPRRVLHMCSNTRVLEIANGLIRSTTNFIYIETLVEEFSKLHLAGQYHDLFAFHDQRLRIKERVAVYDNYSINNVLVYPI